MIKCEFGVAAQDGDYVLIAKKSGYQGRTTTHYLGRVYNDRVYTGVYAEHIETKKGEVKPTFIHSLSAVLVVDPRIVPEKTKADIQYDLHLAFPRRFTEPEMTLERFMQVSNWRENTEELVEQAFNLCKSVDEVNALASRFTYGFAFGSFMTDVSADGVEVTWMKGINNDWVKKIKLGGLM